MSSSAAAILNQAITAGITTTVNQLGAKQGCDPLCWSAEVSVVHDQPVLQLIGQASADYADGADAATVVGQWAQQWDLDPVEQPPAAGTVEYQGRIEQFVVTVWAVIDRATFETSCQ